MANTIILKKSSTASAVPAAASLQPGELAINLADKKLYSKTTGGTVIQVGFGDLTSGLVTTALGYTPVQQGGGTGQGTNKLYIGWTGSQLALQVDSTNFGASWPINVTGSAASITGTYSGSLTSSQVTTALGYTPYNSTNPNGYTSNTGTVTSVSGTGTVSGLTLSGTVTGSGSLTLGGTLSLTSGQVTGALGYTPSQGLQSTGQQVISATTSLGSTHLGSNILVVTGGITLTLPTSAATGRATRRA